MSQPEFDYMSARWKRVRDAALRRDGYQCRRCRRFGRVRPAEIVHHIKHADEYPALAFQMSNLVSLCRDCHNKAHPEKGGRRDYGRGAR